MNVQFPNRKNVKRDHMNPVGGITELKDMTSQSGSILTELKEMTSQSGIVVTELKYMTFQSGIFVTEFQKWPISIRYWKNRILKSEFQPSSKQPIKAIVDIMDNHPSMHVQFP